MTDPQHDLLCRAYGPAPASVHALQEPVSDFAFWTGRLADRCGEAVFGLLLADGRIALTRTSEYPPGIYRVPSGGVRPGEPVIEALYREVTEELGRSFEVLRYAGLIVFEFRGPGPVARFPSYCFLLGETAPEPGAGALRTDGEIEAVLAAEPTWLDSMLGVLESIQGPWADWGRYRAASGRLVAATWQDWLENDAPGRPAAAAPSVKSGRAGAGPRAVPGVVREPALLDVSLPVHEGMARYPGDEPVRGGIVTPLRPGAAGGSGWLVSRWTLNAHAGTHVDAPAHLIPGGLTVDRLPLGSLAGPALVVDCRRAVAAGRPVGKEDLPPAAALGGRIVLLKLGLGRELAAGRYDPSLPVLGAGGAGYLVQSGVLAVGVESLSVDPAGADPVAHLTLLGAGLPVIEGLDLSRVGAGEWEFHALPLPLRGAEAAPCRAVLARADPTHARAGKASGAAAGSRLP